MPAISEYASAVKKEIFIRVALDNCKRMGVLEYKINKLIPNATINKTICQFHSMDFN